MSTTEGAALPDPRRWVALATISLATLMVVLDASIINVALPQAQHALGISDANRHWAVTGYAVTFGGLLLLGGRIADFFGRRRMLIVGLVGFAVASALGGLAANTTMLVLARILQGAFAAVLSPAALSLVTVTFTEPRERARAFGVFGAVQGAGGALGLIAGGLLTQFLDWRWCLLVNLPISAIAVAGTLCAARESAATGPRRLDVPGALLATSGSVGLVVGFTLAGESADGWASPPVLVVLVASVTLLAGFAVRQHRAQAPMLPLRIITDRTRGGAFAAAMLVGTGMFGMFLFLAYYLQRNLGYGPLKSGLAFLPFCAGVVFVPLFFAPRLTHLGPRPPMAIGMTIAAAGMFWLTTIDGSRGLVGGALIPLVLMGFGLGLVFTPMNSTALSGIDPGDAGVASGLVNATQQLGGALGVALLNTLYTLARQNSQTGAPGDPFDADLAAYHLAFTVTGILFVIALLCVLVVMRNPAPEPGVAPAPEGSAHSRP
ncbi:MFS transporter [Amycolatopsis pigmentata]|uniref:MFS transporter n=1 Tax=Amycolatopsis pigmentata TaxID=450801 RepID=A0ABW5FM40_9PSEU